MRIKNHKIACEQIISKLYWLQDEIDSPCHYIQPIMTTYGICYSLNMIPNHLLRNTNDHDTYVSIQRCNIGNHRLAWNKLIFKLPGCIFWTIHERVSWRKTKLCGLPKPVTVKMLLRSIYRGELWAIPSTTLFGWFLI